MKVTKDDKQLYTFLDGVYMLFGKTNGRKAIIGDGNYLYFYTDGYAGRFQHEKYYFESVCYNIGKTPDGEIVIDNEKEIEMLEETLINRIDTFYDRCHYRLEVACKTEEYKVAKICADTGFWLKDEDIKILNKYKFLRVCINDSSDVLIVMDRTTDYNACIIFNFDLSYEKSATQLTIDMQDVIEVDKQEEEKELDELMEDSFEDEYDPMA